MDQMVRHRVGGGQHGSTTCIRPRHRITSNSPIATGTSPARAGRVVLDRCFVSELVYGPLRHGRSRLAWSDAVDLSATLAARSGAFVHLTDEPAAIRRRLLDRGDTEPLALRDIGDLVAGFERVFDSLAAHAPVLRIRTDLVPRLTA